MVQEDFKYHTNTYPRIAFASGDTQSDIEKSFFAKRISYSTDELDSCLFSSDYLTYL